MYEGENGQLRRALRLTDRIPPSPIPAIEDGVNINPKTLERIPMKPMNLLLLGTVLLSGFATLPSSAADQPEAGAPAGSAAPSVQPVLGPTLLAPVAAPAAPVPVPAAVRVGIIDMERISSESAMGKSAKEAVKEQQQKYQKQLDAKKNQLDKLQADIERKMPTLKPAQRDAQIKDFQKKVEEMQKYGKSAEKELVTVQNKRTKEILDAIEEAAVQIGKASGLAAVVVKGSLLYLESGVGGQDISDEVVTMIDAKVIQK
jgi:outer membrane protein